jgi:hypothetical protein
VEEVRFSIYDVTVPHGLLPGQEVPDSMPCCGTSDKWNTLLHVPAKQQ